MPVITTTFPFFKKICGPNMTWRARDVSPSVTDLWGWCHTKIIIKKRYETLPLLPMGHPNKKCGTLPYEAECCAGFI
jgi:hypothetical protein